MARDRIEWLTIPDVAGMLRMTQAAVRRAVFRGQLPVHRLGRRIRLRIDEVEAALVPGFREDEPAATVRVVGGGK